MCPVVAHGIDCSDGVDLTPQRVMNLLRLGMRDLTLGSRMVWDCATCYQCQENCPEGVRVTDIMCELRALAVERLGSVRTQQGGGMKYALFLGCAIPSRLPAYETSTRAVLAHLGVTLVDLAFSCCGYPARNVSRDGFVVTAARNLALAEQAGLDVLTPCKCCFGTLRHAIRFLDEDAALRSRVAQALAADGLAWSGKTEVCTSCRCWPGMSASTPSPPPSALRARASRVAAQYGCHALRPGNVTRFDNPLAPTIFESLIRVTGATPVDWPRRLDCCGDPLHEANAPLSARMTQAKIADALESGAEVLCTACPHCQLRFDSVQAERCRPGDPHPALPAAPRPGAGPAGGVPRAVAPGAARIVRGRLQSDCKCSDKQTPCRDLSV